MLQTGLEDCEQIGAQQRQYGLSFGIAKAAIELQHLHFRFSSYHQSSK